MHVPILESNESSKEPFVPTDDTRLTAVRRYIASLRSASSDSAKPLDIPTSVSDHIQSSFVKLRKEANEGRGGVWSNVGEEELKRWMKLARVLASSWPERRFTTEIWERALEMDKARLERMAER